MKMTTLVMLIVLSAPLVAAEKMKVELIGGFHAATEKLISTGNEKSAFIYSVRGATKLTGKKGKQWKFSIDCLGFDEVGSGLATSGIGRCIWADADNDKLYVSLHTEGESNHIDINGGTGKWVEANGKIVTTFVYLPAPSADIFLGIEEGKGHLSAPALKR